MSFSGKLAEFAIESPEKANLAARKIAIDLFSNVVKSTPVELGTARANWHPTIGKSSDEISDLQDSSGAITINKIISVCNSFAGNGAMYLTNNLPYIQRLADGYSPQAAPGEMIDLNVKKAKDQLRKVARELR